MTKKEKSASRRPAPGTNSPREDVEAYFAAVPEPAHRMLTQLRALIRSVVPAETTETISYRMPTFLYKGSLVAIAAFKDHCSFFPMGSAVLDEFNDELKPFRTSKGTLQFPLDRPLPTALIKKLVKARVARNKAKSSR